ncbi:MAG TPA: zinc-dependent metalloprotease [Acidimicrobiales bacterium]|nr:zinc-dependent metalloprotease [Acidimicrobiales bacterium]
MSGSGPFGGGGNPFEGLFGELARLLSNQGPVNLEIARQLGQWLATEGQPESNPDPVERIRYEELVRVADLHVSEATGLSTSVAGHLLTVRPVGRAEWARRTLDAYQPLFEGLAASLATADDDEDRVDPDPETQLLGGMSNVVGPLLLGIQAGSMVGHLARRALSEYELPVPRPPSDELVIVPANVTEFAADWSLSADDVRLWLCLGEITHHAVLGRPHVRERLGDLLRAYVGGFRPDPHAFEDKLTALDPTDPQSFQAVLGQPGELLGAMETPEQRELLARIEALVVAVEGYTDHVLDTVGSKLVGGYGALVEALRRRRAERGEGERFVARLFGLDVSPAHYERGRNFVKGVVERAGEEGLARLWKSAHELPTPAEVDAPGLWLARIDIPD